MSSRKSVITLIKKDDTTDDICDFGDMKSENSNLTIIIRGLHHAQPKQLKAIFLGVNPTSSHSG